jgi:hypothetical protein
LQDLNLTAVVLGTDSEVNPIAPLLIPLDEELIEIPFSAISDIQQGVGIAEGLFYALASDINGATCEVIAG